jgi:hypothetical protein
MRKEPESMAEIHRIREEMVKMNVKEKEELLRNVRKEYKNLIINE